MQPVAEVGSFVPILLLLVLITPIITAGVLSKVILPEHRSFKQVVVYYLVSVPVLFTLSVLWLRVLPNGLNGYFLFSCCIVLLHIYLLFKKQRSA